MPCRRQLAQHFVPIELLSCTRLRHLSFIGCQGLFLPPVIGELISLETLRVSRTDLADTRDAIHPCTFQRGSFATYSLRALDLSACNLDVLPFQASPLRPPHAARWRSRQGSPCRLQSMLAVG